VGLGGGNEPENLEASVQRLLAAVERADHLLATRYREAKEFGMASNAVKNLLIAARLLKSQVAFSTLTGVKQGWGRSKSFPQATSPN